MSPSVELRRERIIYRTDGRPVVCTHVEVASLLEGEPPILRRPGVEVVSQKGEVGLVVDVDDISFFAERSAAVFCIHPIARGDDVAHDGDVELLSEFALKCL